MNSNQVANKIIDNLLRRKGFDTWWNDIEEDIQAEIIEEIILEVENGRN